MILYRHSKCPNRDYKITPREVEVYQLISQGLSTKEIASNMYLSYDTIKSHRKNLMQKVGARNAAMLVRKGFEMGIIS